MFASPLDEAKTLLLRGEFNPAIQRLTEFLNGEFYHDEALFMLGSAMIAMGNHGLGAVLTSCAIDARQARKNKAFPEAMLNLGACYKAEGHPEMAARIWEDALKFEDDPVERAKIMVNMATLYINAGAPEGALEWCRSALDLNPANHHAMANLGMACLEMGKWAEGWKGWSHTYATGDRAAKQYPDIPVWDGSPGKTLIVWGDQGIGDEIFFAQSLPDLVRVAKKVILDCHPRLETLFRRSFPDIEVHGTRKDLGELPWLRGCGADAAVGLADLHGHFRNDTASWGDGRPYIVPDADAVAALRGRKLRIGLSWTGGSKRTHTEWRSFPLPTFEPVLHALPEAEWFSLQYTPSAAREVCELEERTGIRVAHWPGWVECFDYDRTASFVASLDLLITVCTTVHHLGGAMGVPTWTLVPDKPSWRYQLKGDRLPWYASAKLFRQKHGEDWGKTMERVAAALREFTALPQAAE